MSRVVLMAFALPVLIGCATQDPCSPRAAAAVDGACAHAVVDALDRYCPLADDIDDCPHAIAVLAACDAQIEYHAEMCRR